jgi:hypothetical protein
VGSRTGGVLVFDVPSGNLRRRIAGVDVTTVARLEDAASLAA